MGNSIQSVEHLLEDTLHLKVTSVFMTMILKKY